MISLRPDRFLTVNFFDYFISGKVSPGDKRIPILMYHSVSDGPEKETRPYYYLNTSTAVFEAHMNYLHENDYSVIGLRELKKKFAAPDSIRHAVITFDDGYRDFLTGALPILRKHGFGATMRGTRGGKAQATAPGSIKTPMKDRVMGGKR